MSRVIRQYRYAGQHRTAGISPILVTWGLLVTAVSVIITRVG
jgi:hypothetical protein